MVADIKTGSVAVNGALSPRARQILSLLPELMPGELHAVQTRTTAILGMAGAATPASPAGGEGEVTDWLLCGIEAELRSRGGLARGARLAASPYHAKYKVATRGALASLERACGGGLVARERAALGRVAAECLAVYIEAMRQPVCARTMLQRAGEVAAAVDASFPDYTARGMLRLCLDRDE